jgi:MFS family permease
MTSRGERTFGPDTRVVLSSQALRALAYGFGSVQLGAALEAEGWSGRRLGVFLGFVVAGAALSSVLLARFGDRVGRRRCYRLLWLSLGCIGASIALTTSLWVLLPIVLTGALSTEVVETGPFTTLEQSMIASDVAGHELVKGYGWYNAIATLSGSVGALAAGGPKLLRDYVPGAEIDRRLFWVLVPIAGLGLVNSLRLSPAVERQAVAVGNSTAVVPAISESRSVVRRLSGLFAIDSFGGGFVVQTFLVFWLRREFDASTTLIGVVFFAIGIVQTLSFLAAPLLARRIGLLYTMVFTHIPSNMCLVGVAFAPSLGLAIAFLVGRALLGQMDVPTRQAYVMALVPPAERTAAAAYTNTARYVARPWAPLIAGPLQSLGAGLPFAVAGVLKTIYDVALWRWFKDVELPTPAQVPSSTGRQSESSGTSDPTPRRQPS